MPMSDDVLQGYRQSIDNIDAALVHLLAERFKVTQAVGRHKATAGLPAADAGREITGSEHSAQALRDGNEQGVPDGMAIVIVDQLEAIEVEAVDRDDFSGTRCRRERLERLPEG